MVVTKKKNTPRGERDGAKVSPQQMEEQCCHFGYGENIYFKKCKVEALYQLKDETSIVRDRWG